MAKNNSKNSDREEKEERELSEEEYEQFLKIKELSEKIKKEIDKSREAGEKLKDLLIKNYDFISAIGLIAPIANKIIEENMEDEERLKYEEEKKKEKNINHLFIIIPDEKANELPKLSLEAIKACNEIKPKLWLHFFTLNELWQICFDSKYDLMEAISMAIPIYDTGILGALRVATIHKMMVLNKFERYVVSYVLAGSIVRGQATKTSDVDVFIVIDDTDVKRMSRWELRERLRSIIISYAIEANERANSQNKLSPQIYILTDFWESVKEAHPVIFTFIRDGVPLYDRGAFMPWKLLLKMGKIKPSPEAIEKFMSLGEKVVETVKNKLNTLITEDIYWGVITPSQATLMLYGIAPPTPRETVRLMKEIFVDKEKILEKKYIDILEKIVELYKKYEHEEKVEIKGKDIDFLLDQVSSYIERLKKLAETIEEKSRKKTIEELTFSLNKALEFIYGKKSMKEYLTLIEKDFVNKGAISKFCFQNTKKFIDLKKSEKKISAEEFEILRKDVLEMLRVLREYGERKEILEKIKNKLRIRYKEDNKIIEGEIIFGKDIFLIPNLLKSDVEKYVDGQWIKSTQQEVEEAIKERSEISEIRLGEEIIKSLEKRFKSFEIIF